MIKSATSATIEEAARLLLVGETVAFPTETVYGLGADARNGEAVAKVFERKGRPRFNPLIVHVADLAAAQALAQFDTRATALATAFWPGPLTLVLPRRQGLGQVSDLVSAGLETIGIRVPGHPVARALLRAAGAPIAAPSANKSGHISPTSAEHVFADFGDSVPLILDGGRCPSGLESTIVTFDGKARLLRAGTITREELEAVLSEPVETCAMPDKIQAPGQLESHYAPRAKVRLNAVHTNEHEALLGFGPDAPKDALNLSPKGDLREAAANLFAYLRKLDAAGPATIAVMPIPNTGLGEAINDRLARAAAPR